MNEEIEREEWSRERESIVSTEAYVLAGSLPSRRAACVRSWGVWRHADRFFFIFALDISLQKRDSPCVLCGTTNVHFSGP